MLISSAESTSSIDQNAKSGHDSHANTKLPPKNVIRIVIIHPKIRHFILLSIANGE